MGVSARNRTRNRPPPSCHPSSSLVLHWATNYRRWERSISSSRTPFFPRFFSFFLFVFFFAFFVSQIVSITPFFLVFLVLFYRLFIELIKVYSLASRTGAKTSTLSNWKKKTTNEKKNLKHILVSLFCLRFWFGFFKSRGIKSNFK